MVCLADHTASRFRKAMGASGPIGRKAWLEVAAASGNKTPSPGRSGSQPPAQIVQKIVADAAAYTTRSGRSLLTTRQGMDPVTASRGTT
jgi:hypothetical protein